MNQTLLLTPIMVLLAQLANAADLKVQPDKENVVASRLVGNWTASAKLTERLTGKAPAPIAAFSFKSDPSIAAKVPAKYAKFFAERKMQVYLAGYVQFRGKDYPFVLTQLRGNPHIMFWVERNGDPFGNGEAFNVMLAVAKDKQNDLLFIGGDFNNQPFSAFERRKTKPDK